MIYYLQLVVTAYTNNDGKVLTIVISYKLVEEKIQVSITYRFSLKVIIFLPLLRRMLIVYFLTVAECSCLIRILSGELTYKLF